MIIYNFLAEDLTCISITTNNLTKLEAISYLSIVHKLKAD